MSNDPLTIDYNIILSRCRTQKQRDFVTRALKINVEEHCTFAMSDFPDLTKGNFRQMIYKLRKLDLIELDVRSSVGFYKVKGVRLPMDFRRITFEGKGVGLSMIPMLRMLRNQPPSIHDLKLKFDSKNLHEFLKKVYPVNPTNQGILLNRPLGDFIYAKILVYPNTVQVDLACTFKPFVYDVGSAIDLTIHVGRLYEHLLLLSHYSVKDIPIPGKWIVTHYHFGKDGKEGYSGEKFERTLEDVAGGFIRFYSKTMPDGKVIPRLEQIFSPHHTLQEQLDQMIREELIAIDV